MAINATAVWRIRIAGDDTNGAGYDSAISGAGTDYSQQDSPQLSVTDAVGIGTTTLTSVTGGFTTAMIGNAIRISAGTGATVGYYFITARTDTNTITIDRSPGTGTGWTAKVGGAAATLASAIFVNANSTGNKCVAGNAIYVRGAGTDTPGSADYTISSRGTLPSGTTSAPICIIGENGRPFIDATTDIPFLSCTCLEIRGVLIKASHASAIGLLHGCSGCIVMACTLKLNAKAGSVFSSTAAQCSLLLSEVDGGCTSAVSGNGVGATSGTGCNIVGNYIHDVGGIAIELSGNTFGTVVNNIIQKPWGIAINISATLGPNLVANNTIDNGQSDGIVFTTQAALFYTHCFNNIISNCSQASKVGIKVSAGTAAQNDLLKNLVNNNCVYNCTSSYSGISAGSADVSTDPLYTNQASADYRLGSSSPCKATGTPGQFLNGSNNISYQDMGALQRQESGGGGVAIVNSRRNTLIGR